jgi:hypothetical protein
MSDCGWTLHDVHWPIGVWHRYFVSDVLMASFALLTNDVWAFQPSYELRHAWTLRLPSESGFDFAQTNISDRQNALKSIVASLNAT